ncbi:hypothetical protein NE626_15875, partial [Intestinimonas massiliensis]|uniref:hypothetical protein n=1 Tax=Intestinimonas massiliensis (ex Afouda et al. 2020) TaxID=1673721 RepID=UPI00210C706E
SGYSGEVRSNLQSGGTLRLMTAEELCRRLREEYEAELSDAGVTFQVDCRCPQEQVICNWEHMRRFLGNLIGNSFQHAESDHLELQHQLLFLLLALEPQLQ